VNNGQKEDSVIQRPPSIPHDNDEWRRIWLGVAKKQITTPAGHEWRSLFFTWRVEVDEYREVSFPFAAGFGCGASMKITQGEKFTLQTQYKIGGQLGGKVGVPGVEVSAGVSSEISETLVHELSVSSEWSYASRPCEYCTPQVHFPDARVRILSRRLLHLPLPLFVTRKTVFVPGEPYEIRAHCRHTPEKCENCTEAEPSPGSGAVMTATGTGGPTHVDRVMFAARMPAQYDLKQFLKEILSTPDDEAMPEQVYLHEFEGKLRSVSSLDDRYALYSIDDIDRALGAVRVSPGSNSFFLLTKRPTETLPLIIELEDENGDHTPANVQINGEAQHNDFRFIQVDLTYPQVNTLTEQPKLKLRVRSANTTDEWPAIVVKGA
jgi:hypothetical protein